MSSKLRFSRAAYALELNDTTLKHWLKREQVHLESGYGGGWAEFTFRDLATLVIVRELVKHGVGVEAANTFARYALDAIWRPEFEIDPEAATADDEGWMIRQSEQLLKPLPARLFIYANAAGRQQVTWGRPTTPIDADSWITIDARRVIGKAIRRALKAFQQPVAELKKRRAS